MQFNSVHFMLFFPVVIAVYFVIPKKHRYIWLLVCSYYFYMGWNAAYALLIAFSTAVTYFCGIIIENIDDSETQSKQKKKKLTMGIGICVNLLILFLFKYFNFTIDSINSVLSLAGSNTFNFEFNILLPVGISFYTFQALGYVIDVYRKEISAERNFLKYALFVSFFPQLVAGPIERSGNLMKQLQNVHEINLWNYERIVRGFFLMMWGFFMKVVIADRAAVVANFAFDNYYALGAYELILGVVFFAVQIYCDFASYSTIAQGASQIMGISLMDNFDTPYFALSIKEFWRRWHISLSTWFRDYLYIPLGGNRKGKVKKYVNLMIVFIVSGFWHGAEWSYVIWGALHGFYQLVGGITAPLKAAVNKKLKVRTQTVSYKFLQMLCTFSLVCFAWIFFRADNVSEAFGYIARLVTHINPWALTKDTIYQLGLATQEMNLLIFAIVILLVVDYMKRKRGIRFEDLTDGQNVWVRPLALLALVVFVLIFGAYGHSFDAQEFIYFQF